MSARDDVWEYVYFAARDNSLHLDAVREADKMVDAFAHELAEQIREAAKVYYYEHDFRDAMNSAADLIDPKLDDGIPDHLYSEQCPKTCCGGNEDA